MLGGGLVALSPLWLAGLASAICALVLLASITPLVALQAALTLAPLRALLSRAGTWPLPLDIGQLAFLLLLLNYLAHAIRQRELILPIRWRQAMLPITFFVFMLLLNGWVALDTEAWLREWLKWCALMVMCFLTISLCEQYGWGGVLSAVLLAASANALLGILQFLGVVESATHLQINAQFTRAYGSFEQPNPFAGLMGMCAPLACLAFLGYALRIRRRQQLAFRPANGRLWLTLTACGASAILLVGATIISWSRGAWLGSGFTILAVLVTIVRHRWQSVLVILLAAIIFVISWSIPLLPPSLDAHFREALLELVSLNDVRGADFTASNYALVERAAHWQAAWRMAHARPWLGFGLGNYESVYADYRLPNWGEALGHAHNLYLNMLAETGIVGMVAYLLLCAILLLRAWRARSHPDPLARCLAIGTFASWVYFCVHSLSDQLLVNNSFLIVGAILGILLHIHAQRIPQHSRA